MRKRPAGLKASATVVAAWSPPRPGRGRCAIEFAHCGVARGKPTAEWRRRAAANRAAPARLRRAPAVRAPARSVRERRNSSCRSGTSPSARARSEQQQAAETRAGSWRAAARSKVAGRQYQAAKRRTSKDSGCSAAGSTGANTPASRSPGSVLRRRRRRAPFPTRPAASALPRGCSSMPARQVQRTRQISASRPPDEAQAGADFERNASATDDDHGVNARPTKPGPRSGKRRVASGCLRQRLRPGRRVPAAGDGGPARAWKRPETEAAGGAGSAAARAAPWPALFEQTHAQAAGLRLQGRRKVVPAGDWRRSARDGTKKSGATALARRDRRRRRLAGAAGRYGTAGRARAAWPRNRRCSQGASTPRPSASRGRRGHQRKRLEPHAGRGPGRGVGAVRRRDQQHRARQRR